MIYVKPSLTASTQEELLRGAKALERSGNAQLTCDTTLTSKGIAFTTPLLVLLHVSSRTTITVDNDVIPVSIPLYSSGILLLNVLYGLALAYARRGSCGREPPTRPRPSLADVSSLSSSTIICDGRCW